MTKNKRKNKQKHNHRTATQRGFERSHPKKKRGTSVELYPSKRLEDKRQASLGLIVVSSISIILVLCGIGSKIADWHEWQILDTRGQTEFATIIETGEHGCGDSTCYHVTYEYQDTERQQTISAENYRVLSNATSVQIIAAGDISRIVGTRPDVVLEVAGLAVLFGFGLFLLIWSVHTLRKVQRELATQRFHPLTEDVVEDPRNAALCRKVVTLDAQGTSHREIARILDLQWSQVGQILGKISLEREGRNGKRYKLRKKILWNNHSVPNGTTKR